MKKIALSILAVALILAFIIPPVSFAAADKEMETKTKFNKDKMHQSFNPGNHRGWFIGKEELMEIVNQYTPELTEQFENVFKKLQERKEQNRPPIDDETKQKLGEIRKQVEEGKLTREEAKEEMAELGIDLPKGKGDRIPPPIDDETKQKLDEIRKQVEEGKLTREEAKEKIMELGINLPKGKGEPVPPQLDDETKQKLDEECQIYQQLKEAVDAGNKEEIKALLQKILDNLESRLD